MKSKCWLIVTIALVVVLLLAGGGWLLFGHGTKQPIATKTPATQQMPAANVQYLEQAINSSTKQTQAAALVAEFREAFLKSAQPPLPQGVQLHIKPNTFTVEGPVTARVDASLSNGESYKLHLMKENNQWLILYTEAK